MSYSYWDDFYRHWLNNTTEKAIGGWTNPDETPLFNTLNPQKFSSAFVPEPWWGNDGESPLHSVVINCNPGEGDSYLQERSMIHGKRINAYRNIVNSDFLLETANWHWTKRALPILRCLEESGCIAASDVCLSSHLSVELIPWHTKMMKPAYGYHNYLKANLRQVFDCCFVFAANESRRIANNKLKNKVIIRKSWTSLKKEILGPLRDTGVANYSACALRISVGMGNCCKFEFDSIPNVQFVCIWSSVRRNDFPFQNELKTILHRI